MTTKPIREFETQFAIPAKNLYYYLKPNSNGVLKKEPIGAKNNMPIEQVLALAPDADLNLAYTCPPEYRDTLVQCRGLYLTGVPGLHIIDIDDPTVRCPDDIADPFMRHLVKQLPWCEGNTKGIHASIIIDDMPKYSNPTNVFANVYGDLVKDVIFERHDKMMHNVGHLIPRLSYNKLIQTGAFKRKENGKLALSVASEREEQAEPNPDATRYASESTADKHEKIRKLLKCMSKERVTDYASWNRIQLVVKNELGMDGYPLMDECSKMYGTNNYNAADNLAKYRDVRRSVGKPLGIGSLVQWAREDNPSLYNELFPKKTHATRCAASSDDDVEPLTDSQAAELFVEEYGSDMMVYCRETLYLYDKANGMWTTDHHAFRRAALGVAEDCIPLRKFARQNKNYNNMKSYFEASATHNDSWMEDTQHTSRGKLLYTNGYYDMSESVFYDHFDPNIVFWERIPRKWRPRHMVNEALKDNLFLTLFINVFLSATVADYTLLNLARAIAADEMKKFVFGIGSSNGGKGVLVAAMRGAFGSYVDEFAGENLLASGNTDDKAKSTRWALLQRWKRLMFSNELEAEQSHGSKMRQFSGNAIKRWSSGGDAQTGRMHSKNEVAFIPHFMVFMLMNDMLKITPFDDGVASRTEMCEFKTTFVGTEEEVINEMYKLGDPTIKAKLTNDVDYQDAVMWMVLDRYAKFVNEEGRKQVRIQEVCDTVAEWCDEATLGEQVAAVCHITKDDADKLPTDELHGHLASLGLSKGKLTRELKKQLGILSDKATVGGVSQRYYYGLKLRDEFKKKTTQDPLDQGIIQR